MRKMRKKRKLAEECQLEAEVQIHTPAFSSRMAKKRATDKISPSLPKSPAKKAEILENLVKSPRTKKISERRNVLRTNEEQKNAKAMQSLLEDMSEGLSRVKKAKTNDERAAYSAVRSLALGSSVKKKSPTKSSCEINGYKAATGLKGYKTPRKSSEG